MTDFKEMLDYFVKGPLDALAALLAYLGVQWAINRRQSNAAARLTGMETGKMAVDAARVVEEIYHEVVDRLREELDSQRQACQEELRATEARLNARFQHKINGLTQLVISLVKRKTLSHKEVRLRDEIMKEEEVENGDDDNR